MNMSLSSNKYDCIVIGGGASGLLFAASIGDTLQINYLYPSTYDEVFHLIQKTMNGNGEVKYYLLFGKVIRS